MRNAMFTGMFVISRQTRSARLQAELAQKISACVEGWGDEDIDIDIPLPKDLDDLDEWSTDRKRAVRHL